MALCYFRARSNKFCVWQSERGREKNSFGENFFGLAELSDKLEARQV